MSDVQTGNTPPGNGEIGRENRVVETTKRREKRKGEERKSGWTEGGRKWRKRVERGGGFLSLDPRFGFVEDPRRYSSLPIREPFHKRRRAFVCIARKDL